MAGIVVEAAALEADAKTFEKWAEKLDAISQAVPSHLTADNFSYIPSAQELHTAFVKAAHALQEYVSQGSVVMNAFARTLLKTELEYADAERLSAEQIAKVRAELGSL